MGLSKPDAASVVSPVAGSWLAYALGPDAGEWLQQATVAIRAGIPLEVMNDTIQPFPTFSEIYLETLTELTAAAQGARSAAAVGRAA